MGINVQFSIINSDPQLVIFVYKSQAPHINSHILFGSILAFLVLVLKLDIMEALDILLLVDFFTAAPLIASASDPDILTDFVVPENLTSTIDGNFFTFTAMCILMDENTPEPKSFTVLKASASEFPVLLGQSVSFAVLLFPRGFVNPPHTHPRSAELLFLIGGTLDIGFVDAMNKLYTRTLQPGDMFVFPKGLVHFQSCKANESAVAVSSLGSASAGTVLVPATVFGIGITDEVLAKSFKTDVTTVQKIKAGLVPET